MSTARATALVAVTMALVLGTRAQAHPRMGIEGWGAWNRHSMREMNDTLSSFNAEYQTALRPIHDGGGWGLGFRVWPNEDVLVRLG
jgi:hypothetical protein